MRSGRGAERLAWLRSQGLGLVCAGATVVLLAVGSFVLAATRDGASAGIQMDDLKGFFAPPRAVHAWLYLLLPVVALYAVNTALATWDTVIRRWRGGVRAPSAYAASIVHVGFLVALVAHGVGGLLGGDAGGVVVASGWQEVPGFGEARLVSLEVERLPDGMPRRATARLELRDAAGRRSEETLGYNAPLSAAGGARLALLADLGQAWVVHLRSGDGSCALAEGQECRLGPDLVRVVGVGPGPGGAPAALVEARGPARPDRVALALGDEIPLAGGGALQLAGLAPEQAILLHARAAPGNPWALAASLLMVAGVALLWRKLVR